MPAADNDRILLDFATETLETEAQRLFSAAKLIRSLKSAAPSEPTLPAPIAPTLRVKGRDPAMALQFFVGVTPAPAADATVTFATSEFTAVVSLPDGTTNTLPVITNPFGATEFNLPGSYPVGAHLSVTEVQVTSDGKRTKPSPAASLLVTDPTAIDATPLAPTLRVVGPDPATVTTPTP